jgi:hypothetical protein
MESLIPSGTFYEVKSVEMELTGWNRAIPYFACYGY